MMGFVVERESSLRNFILTLVEAGVTDEEACSCSDMSCKENLIVSVIIYLVFVSCSNLPPPPLDLYKCSSDQFWTGWVIRAQRRLWTMSA